MLEKQYIRLQGHKFKIYGFFKFYSVSFSEHVHLSFYAWDAMYYKIKYLIRYCPRQYDQSFIWLVSHNYEMQ